MSISPTVIGLDFGSDSVRAVLADASNGQIIASSVAAYPRWAEGRWSDASKSQFRQHPLDYLECMENVIREVVSKDDASRVAGIAVDTTASTPCVVDQAGTPLALLPGFEENPNAMFILWKDHTAIQESVDINQAVRKSPLVMQILADVMNMPIQVVASEQACALGSAMFAAVAAGIYPDIHLAMQAMGSSYDQTYVPIADHVAAYETLYRQYVAYAELVETETMQHQQY